jgi:predicted transcriptional regulator
MRTVSREKFSSQASPDVLAALRKLAASEGRQFQAVLEDALRDYLERQQRDRPRQHVMSAFASSLDEFDAIYKDLAK